MIFETQKELNQLEGELALYSRMPNSEHLCEMINLSKAQLRDAISARVGRLKAYMPDFAKSFESYIPLF